MNEVSDIRVPGLSVGLANPGSIREMSVEVALRKWRAKVAMEHDSHRTDGNGQAAYLTLAFQATWHCLLGCGLGEVVGMIISRAIGMGNVSSIVLAVTLGAVFGLAFGMWPLLRAGMPAGTALRIVLIAEGLSIAVMETAEVLAAVYIPGVMEAGLGEGIFWLGMLAALIAGFAAAFPVNLILVKNGIRHWH